MAKIVTTKSGVKIVLRNPAEKAKRFARQLTKGKVSETGKKLSPTDRAFRIGYLSARSDNADCFKSQRKVFKARKNKKK